MNVALRCVAIAGAALALSACVYYPHSAYGPSWGPYRPGYDREAPRNDGYRSDDGYRSEPREASAGRGDGQAARLYDRRWCEEHAKKCAKLHRKYDRSSQEDSAPPPSR